jgi:hypothetical protein
VRVTGNRKGPLVLSRWLTHRAQGGRRHHDYGPSKTERTGQQGESSSGGPAEQAHGVFPSLVPMP